MTPSETVLLLALLASTGLSIWVWNLMRGRIAALLSQLNGLEEDRHLWGTGFIIKEKAKQWWRGQHDNLAVQHGSLIVQHAQLTADTKDLQGQLKRMETQLAQSERDKEALSQNIASLKIQIAKLETQSGRDKEALNQNIASLNSQIVEMKEELAQSESEKEALNQIIASFKIQIAELETRSAQKEEQEMRLLERGETIQNLKDDKTALEAKIQDLAEVNSRLETEKKALEKIRDENDRELAILKKKNEALNQNIASLNSQIAELEEQLAQSERDKEKLSQNIVSLNGQIAELETDNRAMSAQFLKLKQCNEALENLLLERDATIQNLKDDKTALEAKIQDLAEVNSRLETEKKALEKIRDENDLEIASLKEKVDDLDGQISRVKKNLGELAGQIGHLEDEKRSLKNAVVEIKKTITETIILVTPVPPPDNEHIGVPFEPSPGDTRHVVVGLDFGTYSTKVVIRVRGESTSKVLFLDEPTFRYPPFALPAVVAIDGKSLFFGRHALQCAAGVSFRSLKVALLPPTDGSSNGMLRPKLVAALYLTWVLGRIRNLLAKQGFSTAPDKLKFQIGAPMRYAGDEARKMTFLHVIHAAWSAAIGPGNTHLKHGMALSEVCPRLEAYLMRPIPQTGLRMFDVLAENLAPIVSFGQEASAKPGLYATVDMGAGTTEISVNDLDPPADKSYLHCYADITMALGGNHFKENDRRHAKDEETHKMHEEKMVKDLQNEFKKVWREGYLENPFRERKILERKKRWSQLQVLLSGGGLKRAGLERAIKDACADFNPYFDVNQFGCQVDWHRPSGLEVVGDAKVADLEGYREFLPVAHGLSVNVKGWPETASPTEMESFGPKKREEAPLERK